MKAEFISKLVILAMCSGLAFGQNSNSLDLKSPQQKEKVIDHFDVHDADIRSVLKELSTFSGVDIVPCDDVKGVVSLSVTNKTWSEILGIVCRVNNLAATNEGSYIYVLTNEDYLKRKIDNATGVQVASELSPLKREVIKIFHTPAKDLKESIGTMLSPRGKITVVEHNNSLIIYDTEDNISQIRKMVKDFDIETAQISISCKIIEVSSGAAQQMGIHWGFFDPNANVEATHIPNSTGIIPGALERATYGILRPERFSAALEYLFSDNKGEIVAQPQITTLDNKEARIFMGQQIQVPYLDEAGNTVFKMINAGTALIVKPHISGEGRVLLELSPKKESYTMQNGFPIINEQSAVTNVVVDNGETVVIAGLTSNETRKDESGIPFLKDIPLFGHLFKKSSKTVDKKDLIIFVTPHIIESKTGSAPPQQAVKKEN